MMIIIGCVIFGLVIQSQNKNFIQDIDDSKINLKADIIMPTKVSRPGCEKTDSCYIPSKIVITQGDAVIWKNEDSAFHSVTSGYYSKPTGYFDSEHLDPNESFRFIFEKIGTYDYFCTLHPWMKGQVIVELS
ncbi:MAG: hypothetical protein CK527_05960 [Nitrosarchaeum sp.]|nr:hypothetical protein [Nitrosarchaeum sp.]PHY08479.1 MAG: hypothetical protein CK527_05960 [Nitrosarchaeum sp.]